MARQQPTAGPSDVRTHQPSSFVPRPFPPPALAGIPMEYIVDTLHTLAPSYWNNAETSDCTIIFPIDAQRAQSFLHDSSIAIQTPHVELSTNAHDPAGLGRRVTAPDLHSFANPRMLMRTLSLALHQLHVDYLSAQSTLLRGIFSGASALDLISAAPTSAPPHTRPVPIPAAHRPRLLPSSPHHPVVFLPVPDPSSFHYLVTYMYFGVTDLIEDALRRRVIRWEGLARNVEYLGMGRDIKMFLGRWYHRWLRPARQAQAAALAAAGGAEQGSDDEYEDDEMEEGDAPHPPMLEEPPRGRSRDRSSSSPSSH
ncbi:hypothetical protein DENSPDRAFT_870274 [Dentipellis sp. KUC8613]|nr:hypothetical protein DENSPDRAFT_870274 [Dentipellis sp. KUC8613]